MELKAVGFNQPSKGEGVPVVPVPAPVILGVDEQNRLIVALNVAPVEGRLPSEKGNVTTSATRYSTFTHEGRQYAFTGSVYFKQ